MVEKRDEGVREVGLQGVFLLITSGARYSIVKAEPVVSGFKPVECRLVRMQGCVVLKGA